MSSLDNCIKYVIFSRNTPREVPAGRLNWSLYLVKTAFSQRRKTLRNALKKFTFKESEALQEMLNLRAERLSYEDFFWLLAQII